MLAWLAVEHPAEIGEAQWDALRRDLAPVSRGYLRKLLRESGVPLAPMVEGVRQDDFEALERTLTSLLAEYERGDAERRTAVRKLVIEAKDHARWSAKNPAKKSQKEEMALWLLTWLENPPLFPEWARLRRHALGASK
ncbi:MAG TPA: hypothetical protein VN841_13885 [Bryobacteraceae bacterium]|nr:hypothetical protein [Bryobacteraceae bacterium]